MKNDIHDRIIIGIKAVMLGLFAFNLLRTAVKVWKYGGSRVVVADEDDSIDPPVPPVK